MEGDEPEDVVTNKSKDRGVLRQVCVLLTLHAVAGVGPSSDRFVVGSMKGE